MDPRDQGAVLIAALCQIERRDGCWLVPSQTTAGRKYQVKLEGDGSCSCADHVDGFCCKHIRAVRLVLKRELGIAGAEAKVVKFEEKKVYKRDHPAFNAAQATEKHRVQDMLRELVSNVPEPEHKKRGRKPHSIEDAIFAMALKVYGTKSSRTTSCDLLDAHERGYTSKLIPGVKVCAFFENPAFTPVLRELVRVSALPLAAVETGFAVDSSGFPNTKSENWFDYKKGLARRRTVWTKAHIACGVKTNIIGAVRVYDDKRHDSPQFEALVKEVSNGFDVSEVYADSAYLSAANVELVFGLDAEPFIMPKSNTTGGIGGLFGRMVHYFQFRQEEFLRHYHQRSNVESAFSMVKRKFGEYVRSKTEAAMVNEVLCKFLVHNLCVLNQEQHELGIEPVYWKEEAKPQVA
ncbi:MAG: transposase [Gemmataceae bacterium]|nr:transposase [Gemmataceae bacterium]